MTSLPCILQEPESSGKSECFSYTRWQSQTTNQADHIFATLSKSILWRLVFRSFQKDNFIGKLPGGSSKINRLSLNRCPPYTEIFSKRRKIYSVCVESLSMPLHLTEKYPAQSWMQIRFANTVVPRYRSIFGIPWRCKWPKSAEKLQFVVARHVEHYFLWFWPAPSTLGGEQQAGE